MKKNQIIKDNKYFNHIINKGEFVKNRYFIIYFLQKEEIIPKYGFAVGKKIGKAVDRNHLKRQLKNIVDDNISLFKTYSDYIILPKKFCKAQKYDKLKEELINLIKKEIN